MNGIIIHSDIEIIAKIVDNHSICDLSEYTREGYYITEVDNIHVITGISNGMPTDESPPQTEAEIIASLTAAVQEHLDSTAQQRNYDGILSLCSYATSLDPVFHAEGQACVEWRDACWRTSYQMMADVKAGLRPIPTTVELVAELPTMVWPTFTV